MTKVAVLGDTKGMVVLGTTWKLPRVGPPCATRIFLHGNVLVILGVHMVERDSGSD